ncbi:GNAT family N-acetyltransferase [Streptomyces sp. M19]
MGGAVLKRPDPASGDAEVGYWTAAWARGRGVAPRGVEAVTAWAFAAFAGEGLTRLCLLHQIDNAASCRVAAKCGYAFVGCCPPGRPIRWTDIRTYGGRRAEGGCGAAGGGLTAGRRRR